MGTMTTNFPTLKTTSLMTSLREGVKMTMYVAVDIGCIECGEESAIVGVFTSEDAAKTVLKQHQEWQAGHWHGQHDFFIQEVEEMDKGLPVGERDDEDD
jgi:hypothetical protein